jgi:hypothetical protein
VNILIQSLKGNREAVKRALGENQTAVAAWIKAHRELVGIFLEGDVHLFVKDVVEASLARARSSDGYLDIQAMGVADPVRVEFSSGHAEFRKDRRSLKWSLTRFPHLIVDETCGRESPTSYRLGASGRDAEASGCPA